jgi:hypothetical protein
MSDDTALTVSLEVDYSNGNKKRFSGLRLFGPADIVDVLEAAKSTVPGLDFTFTEDFVDRGGREVGAITAIDGIENSGDQTWRVWVGPIEAGEVRAHVEGTVSPSGVPAVQDGDAITFKLTE